MFPNAVMNNVAKPRRMRAWGAGLAAGLLLSVVATSAASAQTRYLKGSYADLHYDLAAPPSDPNGVAVDLDQVRSAQTADRAAKEEAFADADAYDFDVLMPRFSSSAATTLAIKRRPVLAHMLRWALADAGAYGGDIKKAYPRDRPFVVDAKIQLCDEYYMRGSRGASYPSGHSTNGYLAAMVIAQADPGHANTIMARGVRYGTNRLICGAHYPTDVLAGQRFARFLFGLISVEPVYKDDLACAAEEQDADERGALPSRAPGAASPYSPDCAKLDQTYWTEMSAYANAH